MILDSPENFTSVEICRPVTDGMVKFLDKARKQGDEIFGDNTSTVVKEGSPDESGYSKLVGVGSPRLSLYQPGELKLSLFERRAVAQMNLHRSFRNALEKFETDADPYGELAAVPNRGESGSPDRGLQATMNRVGLRYGVASQEQVEVLCDNIVLKNDGILDPRNGRELSLVPASETSEAAMLLDQAGLCVRGMAFYGRKSVYPMTPDTIDVAFGRMPRDVEETEQREFIRNVKSLLPLTITLGKITTRASRQH